MSEQTEYEVGPFPDEATVLKLQTSVAHLGTTKKPGELYVMAEGLIHQLGPLFEKRDFVQIAGVCGAAASVLLTIQCLAMCCAYGSGFATIISGPDPAAKGPLAPDPNAN